jgi:hypothetical protein
MFASHPSGHLPSLYEQMFAKANSSRLAQHSLGALRIARSFLLLEDDYEVDWEVDVDERPTQTHPHRAPLRGPGNRSRRQTRRRRAGQGEPARHVCVSPVGAAPHALRASRERPRCATGRAPRSRH